METTHYAPGAVVQLRSGGPLLTVSKLGLSGSVYVIYHNSITGKFEEVMTQQECLKPANSRPEVPASAHGMRNTTVTKSSLS